jgi:hypothetical protein
MADEKYKLRLMHEFRNQLVSFLDELIEQFPDEGDFVIIRIFVKDQVGVYDVIGRFIKDLLPLHGIIAKRDSKFFLENDILYQNASVSSQKVNHFRKLWVSKRLDAADREMVWKWMDLFIHISKAYYKTFGYVSGWENPDPIVFLDD